MEFGNRFTTSVDASAVRSKPNATITAAYGGDSVTTEVSNELIFLGLADGVTPDPINAGNESAYTVAGICDSSISGVVTLVVDVTSNTDEGTCNGDNTFSVSVDASGVNTNPILMTLTHGTQTFNIGAVNNRVSLNINSAELLPFNLFNAASYTVTGRCDANLTDELTIYLTDVDSASNSVTTNTTCSSNTYSATLNGQANHFKFRCRACDPWNSTRI